MSRKGSFVEYYRVEVYGDVTLRELNHVYEGERVTVFDGFHGIQEVTRQFDVKLRADESRSL